MAESIGSLHVKLGLDSAQFSEGLKRSKTELGDFGKSIGSIGAVGAALGAALAGAGVGLGVAVKGAIDAADELSKAAQKIGVGVEELSRLKYAADLSDVSLDQLTTGLKKLSVNMDEVASGGTGAAAEAFKRLGISVTDAAGRLKSSDAVLAEIADRFAEMPDGVTKTALAVDLFGKAGTDLIPLVNSGSAGLKQMGDEAARLGIVISEDTAKAAEGFNDNLTRLQAAAGGITTQLAAHMLPAIEGVSNAMVGAANNAASLASIGRALGVALQGIATIAVGVAAAVKAAGYSFFGTFGAGLKLMQGDLKGATVTLRWGGQGMVDAAKGAGAALSAIWTSTGAEFAKKSDKFGEDAAKPYVKAGKAIKAAGVSAAAAAKTAADKLREAADRVADGLLSGDEKYAKDFEARSEALKDAMAADVGIREKYQDALERLEIERQARGFTPMKDPGSVDFEPGIPNNPEFTTDLQDLITRLDEAAEAADKVAFSVEDIYWSLKNNNWTMAVSGMLKAFQSVQKAFATGTAGDKFTALAGVAQGVGSVIGGKTGGAISGAASGALAGLQVGGIPGAAIGAVIGGIAGIFGASSKKKAARREAEERARQAEAERVARVEAARKTLEIELMKLSGDSAGALAKQREYELAALDASLHAQQKAIWAAEDLAEAQAKLAAISATRRDLEIELMQAMGDSSGAIAAQREALLSSLDESLRPLQSAVWGVIDANDALTKSQDDVAAAQDLVREAYDREASAFRETIDRFKGIGASLRDYAASIGAAEDGTMSLMEAAQRFAKVSAAARLGDSDAMSNLQSVSEAFRSAGRGQAKTLLEQLRVDAQVRAAAEAAAGTAERQATIAEQQLDALTQALPANLREIDVTFAEGMAALNEAMAIESDLQLVANAHLAEIARSNPFAEIAAMRADLNAGLAAIAKNTGDTSNTLTRVTRDGDGMVVAA